MLQSLNHDSWSKKIGIKPQIGTILTTGYARALKFMFIRPELGGKVQDVYFSLHTVNSGVQP